MARPAACSHGAPLGLTVVLVHAERLVQPRGREPPGTCTTRAASTTAR
ncbi:hypothetical protein [Nannocystis radixulma]|uniref:Uncharacterized protein n=1 Tax=Nannocystis radixulma TaxID=2995305 RepID=A0ABT5BAT7_9BACT|nr:hypothetical protein [Nannocystis radixulma]MDC0670132.1 hypothetical protein [Nannocystis radixulma]